MRVVVYRRAGSHRASLLHFDGMRMVNTFRAHQLLHWAAGQGRQTALELALFEAFFSRREDVNAPDLLADVAARAGLDRAEASAVLSDARYAQDAGLCVPAAENPVPGRPVSISALPL